MYSLLFVNNWAIWNGIINNHYSVCQALPHLFLINNLFESRHLIKSLIYLLLQNQKNKAKFLTFLRVFCVGHWKLHVYIPWWVKKKTHLYVFNCGNPSVMVLRADTLSSSSYLSTSDAPVAHAKASAQFSHSPAMSCSSVTLLVCDCHSSGCW